MNNIDDISIAIENSIDSTSRLKEGIFFTKENAIKLITKDIDFSTIKSVIDTASGSCNFLIYLASKYKHIQFYGIEKNEQVYRQTLEITKKFSNIKYFHGDMFFDEFDIPLCDLYLGNPPWVNYIDLEENYREKIKKVWTSYFKVKKDFRMLLGDSRGDLSQIFMYYSIKKFLKEDGKFSVIMPLTSIRSKNSSAEDFRSFQNITVNKISEISKINPFINTDRTCCFIEGKNGGQTNFPVDYQVYVDDNKYISKELFNKNGNLIFKDENDISGKSDYIARQGINTLGANDIFFFKEKPQINSNLIKRLLKSSDIKKWTYNPSYWVLVPYNSDGKIIVESQLRLDSQVWDYLLSHKNKLQNRKSKFVKNNFYQLFGVGDYTFKKYKVMWRGLGSKRLECVVVDSETMPNQSMNCYISTDDFQESHYICAIMNSEFYENQVFKICESGSKSFGQPNIINSLIIKKYDQTNQLHNELSKLSISFHDNTPSKEELLKLEKLVEKLYLQLLDQTT